MSSGTNFDAPGCPARDEPVAVVGVGLRFPGGSASFDEFDEFLREGRSGIRPIPTDRWDVAAFTPDGPDDLGKIRTTGGGFLDRVDLFDAPFFNISPKEAPRCAVATAVSMSAPAPSTTRWNSTRCPTPNWTAIWPPASRCSRCPAGCPTSWAGAGRASAWTRRARRR
jgi:Beta-ketoacyl synthase, N-terminal domain